MERKVSGILRKASAATQGSTLSADDGLLALRYEEAEEGKPPIAVTVAPPRAPPTDIHPALRPRPLEVEQDETKRDSGLTGTASSKARESSVMTDDDAGNILGVRIDFDASSSNGETPLSPATNMSTEGSRPSTSRSEEGRKGSLSKWRPRPGIRKSSSSRKNIRGDDGEPGDVFTITTAIPTEGLLEEDFLDKLSFSKRGSMMLGGKKAVNGHARLNGGRSRQPNFSLVVSPSARLLSDSAEMESQKVRSMYESGTNFSDWVDVESSASSPVHKQTIGELEEPEESSSFMLSPPRQPPRAETSLSIRTEYELAGGLEDWEDVDADAVDKYGFINMQRTSRPGTPEPKPGLQRVSTVLQMISDTPRRKRTFGRSPSFSNSPKAQVSRKGSIRKVPTKSLRTQTSTMSRQSTRSNLRAAANRLPGNGNRKLRDEAGDMLTLPPGLADIAEDEEGGKVAASQKKREWARRVKWEKMAKVVKLGEEGQGMEFEFDTRNPKLIERTWKGIPDMWRAAAWFSFLRTSAAKHKGSATEADLTAAFNELQDKSSADDVQIDIDVPRTINSHIMFRKRYRGGQRLLFRVLHALSLYFPETGYVQGMASLAATLLCYFDEEKTFIMLARMWTLRGLDKLYAPGFQGLMSALDEFRKVWLNNNDVAKKLDEFNIDATAYGTRWYLTLFNYSIPFPAQLRVWDVFMLLGDADNATSMALSNGNGEDSEDGGVSFGGGLDVLHATAAALIDGTREILLDSDFENAMKVLTSWIPVKDEELLMKVTRAEWKLHHPRGRK